MGRMPEVGDIIDEVFRVEAEVDSGNFGSVYRVFDTLEHRTLALKVLRPGTHDENELRLRFEREARLIYSLQHPHVVQVYYYGQTPSGLPYLAMEYLQGTDLRTLLKQHGPLHPSLAKRITMETLSALAAAHAIGIIHRDLKPANIFLVNDGHKGHVKVLDFGFAKAFDDEQGADLTNAGTLVGTPAYMAPELVHKKNVGAAADLYAMGLIMAEMLQGNKIVDIDNVYDTILFQASSKPIKLPQEISRGLFGKVIQQSIAKDLKKRFSSANEFMQELSQVVVPGESVDERAPALNELGAGMPLEYGSADVDAATVPRSMGMPSLDEVDRALGQQPSPQPRPKKKTRVQRSQPDPLAPAISGEGVVGNTRQRVRVQTQQIHAVGPTEFGSEPLDSQQFILGAAQAGATGAKHRDTSTIPLDQEYHATGAQQAPSPSHTREILIGVVSGGAVIAMILIYLRFFVH